MFENVREKAKKLKEENRAEKMALDMLSEMILNSEKTPEHTKLMIRALNKGTDVHEAVEQLKERYLHPDHPANSETIKTVLEYLGMVELGIKQFMESTPFVAEETEECEG